MALSEHDREMVEATVDEVLTRVGIDPADPKAAQADMTFLRDLRLAHDSVKRTGVAVALGVVVTATLGLIWLGLKEKILAVVSVVPK